MKKRMISLLLIVAMVCTMAPLPTLAAEEQAPPSFADVQPADWYYDAVTQAAAAGIFNGTGEGRFDPQGSMDRAMYITVIGRIAGANAAEYTGSGGFADVTAPSWYAPYVVWAAQNGIVEGYADGRFGVRDTVTREQMATIVARYFAWAGIPLDEGAVGTEPMDLAAVSPWAREAVLQLWHAGLLQGDDKGNVNPRANATRAEGAAFSVRTDALVAEHFKDLGQARPQPGKDTPQQGSDGDWGDGVTRYYQVTFAAGDGVTGAKLPESKTYARGTKLGELPMPYKENAVFLGWYSDGALTERLDNETKITADITLYAGFAGTTTDLAEGGTPDFVAAADQPATMTVEVRSTETALTAEQVREKIAFHNTNLGSDLDIAVTGGGGAYTVGAAGGSFEAGATYRLELLDDCLTYIYEGAAQPAAIRVYNFTIAQQGPVVTLDLNPAMTYLQAEQVSGLADPNVPVATLGLDGAVNTAENTGTFTYAGGTLEMGETVAIYEGKSPNERGPKDDEGDVAYVTIIGVSGDTYTYRPAEAEEVLFTPDVLPIDSSADLDGSADNGEVTLSPDAVDYSDDKFAEMGLDATTTVDVGDFIAFYSGSLEAQQGDAQFARVTAVEEDGDGNLVITYESVSQADVLAAMDLRSTQDVPGDAMLEGVDQAQVEREIEAQAESSGFVEDASQYLAGLALTTGNFENVGGVPGMQGFNAVANASPAMIRAAAAKNNVELKNKSVSAKLGSKLSYLSGSGVRCDLTMRFDVVIHAGQNDIVIHVESTFQEEIMLSVKTDGGAVWKKKWIFPYISDYRFNANLDVGNYTGIKIDAKIGTFEKGGNWNWNDKDKVQDIGRKMEDLVGKSEALTEKYSEMLANEADWIDLYSYTIFNLRGSADPLHILAYGVSADFVISGNLNMTVGMDFYYANAKRYNFSILLFAKKSTSETIDLKPEQYAFEFYVMGTMGIRAGVRLQVAVGLFSLNLDSVGITADVGAYAQLWGYFYYQLSWKAGGAKQTSNSGALLIEIGIYLQIHFNAQAFGGKYSYDPMLYDKEWPLWNAGDRYNVLDFSYTEEQTPKVDIKRVRTYKLPTSVFAMQTMDLQKGSTGTRNYNAGKDFNIQMTNSAFSFNPRDNSVTLTPPGTSREESGKMIITWTGAPLAFSSAPITRTIDLHWSDPDRGNVISFDSNGGSAVELLFVPKGTKIEKPADPVKQGYVFAGWYTDQALQSAYAFPDVMPDKDTEVYAKWAPATDTHYQVEHYQQKISGSGYTLVAAEDKTGTTDSTTAETGQNYTGFTAQTIEQKKIEPDGSTVIGIYYTRNIYELRFSLGAQGAEDDSDALVYQMRYEANVYAPRVATEGYDFAAWDKAMISTMPAADVKFTASWTTRTDTPYRVEHYYQDFTADSYAYVDMEAKSGASGAAVQAADQAKELEGLTYDHATVNGVEVTEAPIQGDGTLVLKLYYKRDAHTVTFQSEGKSYRQDTHRYGAAVTEPTAPERAGYAFAGWCSDEALEQAWAFGQPMPARDVTLYAKWTAQNQNYTVRHYVEDVNGTPQLADTTGKSAPTGTELTLAELADAHWTDGKMFAYKEAQVGGAVQTSAAIPGSGTLTVDLYYTRQSYTVTWMTDEGEYAKTTVRYGAGITQPADAPTKEGYGFSGWQDEDGHAYTAITMPAADITLTAQWTVDQYTMLFVTGGGTAIDPITQAFGSAVTKPADPTRTGYTFKGWEPAIPAAMPLNGGTYTAQWEAVPYTITLHPNGGTVESETIPYTCENAAELPTAHRTGYNFAGWYADESFSGSPVTNVPVGSTGDKAFYAKWDLQTYTITYSGLKEATNPNPVRYTVEDAKITLADPTDLPDGYAFDGWRVSDGAEVTEIDTQRAANITVQASWKAIEYTITYDLDGGTNHAGNPATYTVESQTFSLGEPTRSGWTFTGWTGTGISEPTKSVRIAMGSTGNKTYTANWSQNNCTIAYANRGDGPADIANNNKTSVLPGTVVTLAEPTDSSDQWRFLGWYDSVAEGARPVTAVTVSGNTTLYARWTEGGTATNPYTISSADELIAYRDKINSTDTGTEESAEIVLGRWNTACYQLTKDLTLPSSQWNGVLIGLDSAGSFSGTFDGGNYTITMGSGDSDGPRGLFDCIGANGVIKNLKVECVYANPQDGSNFNGGIVNTNQGRLTNVSCNYNGSTIFTYTSFGGIAGDNKGTIDGCTVSGSIIGEGGDMVGGIAAYNSGTIKNCTASCSIGIGNTVGGIVGRNINNGTLENCRVTSNVTLGDGTSHPTVGAFGGQRAKYATAINCTNETSYDLWGWEELDQ